MQMPLSPFSPSHNIVMMSTPCKLNKENVGNANVVSQQAHAAINTPTKTRNPGVVSSVCTPLHGVVEEGSTAPPDIFACRELMQVKNTFLHFSPTKLKSPASTPPKTVPSNFGTTGRLFGSETIQIRSRPAGEAGGGGRCGGAAAAAAVVAASTPKCYTPGLCWPSPAPFAEHPLPALPSHHVMQAALNSSAPAVAHLHQVSPPKAVAGAQATLPTHYAPLHHHQQVPPPQQASKVLRLSLYLSSPGPGTMPSSSQSTCESACHVSAIACRTCGMSCAMTSTCGTYSTCSNCGTYTSCGACDAMMSIDHGLPSVPPLPSHHLGAQQQQQQYIGASTFSTAVADTTSCFTNTFAPSSAAFSPPSMPPSLPPALPPTLHGYGANGAVDTVAWTCEAIHQTCSFQPQQQFGAPAHAPQVQPYLEPSFMQPHGVYNGAGGITSVATVMAQTSALAPVLPMPPPPSPPRVPVNTAEPAPPLTSPTVDRHMNRI